MAATTWKAMYESDISSISSASSHTTDSTTFDISDVEVIAAQVRATGANASATGNVIAKLVVTLDGSKYDTEIFATVTVALNGTTEAVATELINVRGCHTVKVTAIENEDGSFAAEDVNVTVGKTII